MLEHRLAIVTAFATFLLLLVGGTVNATGSSLACPEAFVICHGTLFPEMTGGVLYEHGHRLVAMTIGFLQIGLTILLWRRRPGLRKLAVLCLFMVLLQGSLGALTVGLKLEWAVSEGHLALAMLYFAVLIYVAWRTRSTLDRKRPGALHHTTRQWILIACAAIFAQILLGGLVRHLGATLASVDLPFHNGSLWPAGAPFLLKLHMLHRICGVIVGLFSVVAAVKVFRAVAGRTGLRRLALAIPMLVVIQITLGVLTIATFRAVPIAVAHFGGAAALWGAWVTMWLATGDIEPAQQVESGFSGGTLASGSVTG